MAEPGDVSVPAAAGGKGFIPTECGESHMKTSHRQAGRAGVHALACCGKPLAAIVVLLVGLFGMPQASAQTAPMPPAVPLGVPADVGIDQHLNAQIPTNLTFRDEAGHAVQ